MTAPRNCRKCGAALPPDVAWCMQCYEPVRQLTPREPPLPPIAEPEEPPPGVRHGHMWIRLDRPVYSRVRGGPTNFGLWGRIALTAVVLFWLPWGNFTVVTLFYLVGYLPIAGLLLAAIWRRGVVGPAATAAIVPDARMLMRIRAVAGIVGLPLVAVAVTASATFLGYLPAVPFLAAAVLRPAAVAVDEAIAEAKAHPLGALVLLNGLNVLDAILSDAAIGAGTAKELNPIVMAMGGPAKLALVALCSALLHWKRPSALVWPSIAFVALAAYHLTGLLGGLALA